MIETVNGYVCRNCSDVALAKRNVDPAHPKDGPNGVDAKAETDPLRRDEAVTFGGALAEPMSDGTVRRDATAAVPGTRVDVRA